MRFLYGRANQDIEESEKDKLFSSTTFLTRIIDSRVVQTLIPSGDSLIADLSHEDNGVLRSDSRSRPRIDLAKLGSPALVDICMDHSENTAPLHRWLVKVNQSLGS